jgi:DNA helicase-2/ATP-dependent DNA helicase PcrA
MAVFAYPMDLPLSGIRQYNYSMGFMVNGVAIPDPATFTGAISDLDSSAERDATGTLHRCKVATKTPLKLGYKAIEWDMFKAIAALIKEELEEERRLAYVALTRAEQRVYALCAKERLLFGKTLYNPKSRFLDEIGEEYKVEEILEQKPKYRTEFGEKTKKFTLSNEFTSKSSLTSEVGKTKKVESFVAGDRVKHYMFGEGTVLSVREMGADVLYEVEFDKAGTKKLMATYAKLLKI